MVEAAGIEPASENRAERTSTCIVDTFYLTELLVHRLTYNSASYPLVSLYDRKRSTELSRQVDISSPINGQIREKRVAFI